MRVAMHQPGSARRREVQRGHQDAGPIALRPAAAGDDPGQRRTADPLRDDDLGCAGDDARDQDVGVTGVRRGEATLRSRLQGVVQLLDDAGLEFGQQRLDVQPGNEDREHPGEPGQLVQVGQERRTGARILDLDGDLATVVPDRAVDLPDARRSRGAVVEVAEAPAPVAAQLLGQDRMHGGGGHGRRGFLQLGQCGAVRPGDVLGKRCLEDAQRLAELHCPALELAEDAEQLLGRALLELEADLLGRSPAQAFPEPDRGPTGDPQRQ